MLATLQGTLGTRPVHLARTHDQLGNVLAPVLHHLADSTVAEDVDAEEVVATFADLAPSAHVSPSGTSLPAPEHSKEAPAVAAHSAELEAAAVVPLEELRVAALAVLASQTEHVLLVPPWGNV